MSPKILLFDIETAPILLYAWKLGDEVWHPKFIRRNWFVLCWSAKWLGKRKMHHSSLPEFRGYKELPGKTKKHIDKKVMKGLWDLLDECDIAIAHNLKAFDRKKANTRFTINKMPPPSPYQMVDTLSVARSQFKFTSNKLEYLAKKLGVTQKMDSGGFELWLGCEDGDKRSWNKMQRYCNQDVRALESVYLKLRPYISNHPNITVIVNYKACPKCGHTRRTRDGVRYTNTGVYQKFRCLGCGGPIKEKLSKKERANIIKNRPTNA